MTKDDTKIDIPEASVFEDLLTSLSKLDKRKSNPYLTSDSESDVVSVSSDDTTLSSQSNDSLVSSETSCSIVNSLEQLGRFRFAWPNNNSLGSIIAKNVDMRCL